MTDNTTLPRADWRETSDGHEADINGARYSVGMFKAKGALFYRVLRDGSEVAGPTCVGAPAGFLVSAAAQRYAEWHADMNRG